MKPIYYLSYSDIPGNNGFVFPSELQQYNYSPGSWFVALDSFEAIPDILEFDAVDNNELLSLKLSRVNRMVFLVDTFKYGKFFFRAMHKFYNRYDRYVGNSKLIAPDNRLFQILPLEVQRLENVCKNSRFFFVGRIDSEIENQFREQ